MELKDAWISMLKQFEEKNNWFNRINCYIYKPSFECGSAQQSDSPKNITALVQT